MNRILLFCVVIISLITQARADHLAGGEMYYECKNDTVYDIALVLYLNCVNTFGQTLNGSENPSAVFIYDTAGTLIDTLTVQLDPSTLRDLPISTFDCDTLTSQLCIQRGTFFRRNVSLPDIPGGYKLIYQRCCRDPLIQNIQNPGATGNTIELEIPENALAICNNTPQFNLDPPLGLCTDVPFSSDQSVTDVDGDSIFYTFCDPLDGAIQCCPKPGRQTSPTPVAQCNGVGSCPSEPVPYSPVVFIAPETATSPIPAQPGDLFTIDPQTGELTGTPSTAGLFTVRICAFEYRNGNLIGKAVRDIDVEVVTCQPKSLVPVFSHTTGCILDGDTIQLNNATFGDYDSLSYTIKDADSNYYDVENPTHVVSGKDQPLEMTLTAYSHCFAQPKTTTRIVQISSIPQPDLGPNDSTCFGSSKTLDPGSYSTYLWSNNSISPTITAADSGTYWVKVTNSNGCEGSDTIHIKLFQGKTVDLGGPDSVCPSGSTLIDAGPGFAQYSWSTGATTQSINEGAGTYTLTVTDDNGCIDIDTFIVDLLPDLDIDLGEDTSACNNLQVNLDAGSGYSAYSWSTGATTRIISAGPGTYHVTVTDNEGCSGTDTIMVSVKPAATVNLGGDTAFCEDTTFTIDAGAGYGSYEWSDGTNIIGAEQTIIVSSAGTYSVTVTDALTGCEGSDDVTISVDEKPEFDLGDDHLVCSGQEVKLEAGVIAESYLWSNNDSDATTIATDSGTYWLYVSEGTCFAVDEVKIEYLPRDEDAFIVPNVFTPDGDGVNEKFDIQTNAVKTYHLTIYNRWGRKLFESDTPIKKWDGKNERSQDPVSEGTYFYILRTIGVCSGEEIEDHGTVTVLLGTNRWFKHRD